MLLLRARLRTEHALLVNGPPTFRTPTIPVSGVAPPSNRNTIQDSPFESEGKIPIAPKKPQESGSRRVREPAMTSRVRDERPGGGQPSFQTPPTGRSPPPARTPPLHLGHAADAGPSIILRTAWGGRGMQQTADACFIVGNTVLRPGRRFGLWSTRANGRARA